VVILKDDIITIKRSISCEFEEKKSRFIGHIEPVETENDCVLFIDKIKKKYWNATHNVYGYYIKKEFELQKYSDDGEPSGTAGLPVLDVIKKNNIQDVCIVVTRYFGGIMLGASGLVRAYSNSAAMVLKESEKIIKKYCQIFILTVEYSLFKKLENYLIKRDIKIIDKCFDQDVDLKCYIPIELIDIIEREIIDLMNDQVLIEYSSKDYFNID
jgi:uncharacterized YigZ family protein